MENNKKILKEINITLKQINNKIQKNMKIENDNTFFNKKLSVALYFLTILNLLLFYFSLSMQLLDSEHHNKSLMFWGITILLFIYFIKVFNILDKNPKK